MKRLLFVLTTILILAVGLNAQTVVKKKPGESVTVAWINPSADNANVSGWRIYASSTSSGSYSFTGVSVVATARQAVFPAAFSTNSVMVFYAVKAFMTSGTTTVESDIVPVGGVEVDMTVLSPVGVSVR